MIEFRIFLQLFAALCFFQQRGGQFVECTLQDDAIDVHHMIRGGVLDLTGTDEANDAASQTQILNRNNSTATVIGTVGAVYDLIDRVLKDPRAKDSICLRIVDPEAEDSLSSSMPKGSSNQPHDKRFWFRLEQLDSASQPFDSSLNGFGCTQKFLEHDSFDTQAANNTKNMIVITATSASELTAGLGYYFKHYCNFTLEWSTGGRAGGSHIVLPRIWPVPLEKDNTTITRYRTTKWSYLMNVCTHSYSLVWYDWAAWQSLIDNMALRGINMVLAMTGQEEIQYKVFSKLGLKDDDIRSWFNGPAFLTWSRGQNEYGSGIAGPLPRSFMKSQWALQRNYILPRLRSLGMVGILPAFQGNVPIQLKALYNDTNITQQAETGWMNSLDPLFLRIADLWMSYMIEDFGTDHYYQLDGWFNGGVPPWMNNNPKHRPTATERRLIVDGNSLDNKEPKTVSHPIPHDENWYKRGQAAYAGLNRTDPNAHWMYQGFAFVDWKTHEQASYVKGLVDSAPHGKLIVIDMEYSPDGEWQKWGNASFFGAPFIWSKLHNFGDTSGMRGDLGHINSAFPYQALDAQASIIGIGATPEGIDQNPLYYDFLFEQNFRHKPVKNLTAYLVQQNHKRYGLHEADQNVSLAWTYLLKSAYSQDFSVQDLTGVTHLNPRQSSSLFERDRSTPKPLLCNMFNAWTHLLYSADTTSQWTDPFLYDLVNVGREVLAQLSTPIALNFSDARSAASMNRDQLIEQGGLYIQLLKDLDSLLSTNRAFLLQPWLDSARRLAQEDKTGTIQYDCLSPILRNKTSTGSCAAFYEFNARSQITTWNPTPFDANHVPDGPVDYAAKHWGGLIHEYYVKRANLLLQQALRDERINEPLNSTEVERLFAQHAHDWTTSVNEGKRTIFRKTIQTSKEMFQKYSHWFKDC